MTFIEDFWWRIWGFWSVRIQVAAAALTGLMFIDPQMLLGAWNMMPSTVRDIMPPHFLQAVGALLFAANILAILARGIVQKKLEVKPDAKS